MDEKYRLVFRGEVLDGQHRAVVKRRLMEALNLSEAQLEALFSGKAVVLKKSADARTAARYQGIFKKAGGRLRVLPVEADPAEKDQAPPDTPPAAERNGAAGESAPRSPASGPEALTVQSAYTPPPAGPAQEIVAPDFVVAEIGTDLVDPRPTASVTVPEADFELAEVGADLLESPSEPATAAVRDVDFELAEVGADIGVGSDGAQVAPPDTSHLQLAES